MGETILTRELTAEQRVEEELRDRDWDRFQILLDCLYDGYLDGDIKLENMCKLAVTIATEYEGSILLNLPGPGRDRMIGALLIKALRDRPLKARASNPAPLKNLVAKLVGLAHKDGYGLAREHDNSAFEFIAAHMQKLGIDIKDRTVEKYWQQRTTDK